MSEKINAVNEKLKQLLTEELDTFNQFKQLLVTEQEHLVSGDSSTLLDIANSKASQIDRLNALFAEQLKVISSLGYAADKKGITDWVEHCSSEQRQLWDTLVNLVTEIQQANKINGKLVNTRLQHTQQLLSSLMAAANQASLYGPSGRPEGTPQTKSARGIIGKA